MPHKKTHKTKKGRSLGKLDDSFYREIEHNSHNARKSREKAEKKMAKKTTVKASSAAKQIAQALKSLMQDKKQLQTEAATFRKDQAWQRKEFAQAQKREKEQFKTLQAKDKHAFTLDLKKKKEHIDHSIKTLQASKKKNSAPSASVKKRAQAKGWKFNSLKGLESLLIS